MPEPEDRELYFGRKLREGVEFEDHIIREFYQIGLVLVGFSSRKYQKRYGENLLGAEIKRDGHFRDTFNLFLETAERSRPDQEWVPSGILRDDHWLYIIGDEETAWIFSSHWLREMAEGNRWKEAGSKIGLSQGLLMPLSDAERYCIRRLDMGGA